MRIRTQFIHTLCLHGASTQRKTPTNGTVSRTNNTTKQPSHGQPQDHVSRVNRLYVVRTRCHIFDSQFESIGEVKTRVEKNKNKLFCVTHLMLIRYWASATESGLPLMVIVRSVLPPSRSSQFEMRIMAPEICRISAILVPPLPMMQPIRSFGTVISCCCWLVCGAARV